MANAGFNDETTINANLSNPSTLNASLGSNDTTSVNLPPINYIPGYKIAEEERRANEVVRQENETQRIALYEDMEYKLETGYFDGADGVSLEYVWDGTSLGIKRDDEQDYTYVDLKGAKGDTGDKGDKGDKGDTGATGQNGRGIVSITVDSTVGRAVIYKILYTDNTTSTFTVYNGANGQDGYSPSASVSKVSDTATITITDKNGTTTASITDGIDGQDGTDGQDGYSPTATVSKSGKVATITITDKNGTTTTEIRDGEDGQGSGDMLKSTYDTNDNGIVDNAEKVNNHTVLTDVPANAVFTDTTYTAGTGISITNGVISNTQTSAEWGNITGTLADQTDLNTALSGKADTSSIPTKVSDLTNDIGFITNTVNNLTNYYTSSNTYTKTEVNNLIGQIDQFKIQVVQTLPVSDIDTHTIYLVPKTGSTGDAYNEYLYINNSWELIGSTDIDLTNYVQFTDLAVNGGTAGVVKVGDDYGIKVDSNGKLYARLLNYNDYTSANQNSAVSKGTLENVITGKALVNSTDLATKQDTLVSGTNIKTINNTSILGSGNITVTAEDDNRISIFESKRPVVSQSGSLSSGTINFGTNASKDMVQMNGILVFNKTGDRMIAAISSDLRPTNATTFDGCFITYDSNANVGAGSITISTNGTISFALYNPWRSTVAVIFIPVTLYIN